MSRNVLIGLAGDAGSGKDTAFKILEDHVRWWSLDKVNVSATVTRLAFADAVKAAVYAKTGLAAHHFDTLEKKEAPIAQFGGLSYRQMCQREGTEFGRDFYGPNVWVDRVLKTVRDGEILKTATMFVVTDVRFDNEAEAIHAAGGKVVKIVRPGAQKTSHSSHASENGLSDHHVSEWISNDGDLSAFKRAVLQHFKMDLLHLFASARYY